MTVCAPCMLRICSDNKSGDKRRKSKIKNKKRRPSDRRVVRALKFSCGRIRERAAGGRFVFSRRQIDPDASSQFAAAHLTRRRGNLRAFFINRQIAL